MSQFIRFSGYFDHFGPTCGAEDQPHVAATQTKRLRQGPQRCLRGGAVDGLRTHGDHQRPLRIVPERPTDRGARRTWPDPDRDP